MEQQPNVDEEVSPLLVLDLDGTLLDTVEHGANVGSPDFSSVSQAEDGKKTDTYVRPGVADFVATVLAHGFQLAVWTAAPRAYAEEMVDGIDRTAAPGFKEALSGRIFADELTSCSFVRGRMLRTKDLQKLVPLTQVPLHRILIVDDTPETYALNIRNALPVEAWMSGYECTHLAELAAFLVTLDIAPAALLDVSGWQLAPNGAGPLSLDAIQTQQRTARRASMAQGPPIAAWSAGGAGEVLPGNMTPASDS